jgi:hypothetical protein
MARWGGESRPFLCRGMVMAEATVAPESERSNYGRTKPDHDFAEVATNMAKRELVGRSEAMSDRMPWLIQHDVVHARNAKHHGEPVALLFDGPSEPSAFGFEIRHRFNQVIAHE